ncbi:MAG: methylmalonyl Co-A mutase-associated GTPase MeaB, partial [Nitrosopumilaceae archaeon]|nr:methylmalonyl Co-A mutase-associated GTPase MeaB [Nitrosopumilaceae archaeon]NIV66196.1 methylmalonyl Co-A mutase-associated GTPase MeaB [Nitrosopumilaceae archaeon]NIX62085.1 methylmalonyl Co-A mutase-associated GTPase MeaB [Nitrosopumilaceae archaeon]
DSMLDSDKAYSTYLKKLQSRKIDPFAAADKITKSLLK